MPSGQACCPARSMAAAWSMSRCRGLRTRAIDYRLEPVLGERDNFPSLGVPKRLAIKQPLNQVWAFLRSVCSRGISAMVSRTLARSEAKASCPNGLARFTAPGGVRIGSRQRILPLQLSPARPRRTGGEGGHNPSDYMSLGESGMAQDESGGCAERVPARTHLWAPEADYGPVRQFGSVGYSLRHSCRDTA